MTQTKMYYFSVFIQEMIMILSKYTKARKRYSGVAQIFLCGHQKREGEYGWDLVDWLAEQLPEFTFHLYGVDKTDNPRLLDTLNEIDTYKSNIIRHGKVSPEQFNREIAQYQCGLRTNEHDGASEVMVKSLLNGGYPITRIKYPNVWNYGK